MDISIIIPTRNRAPSLRETLEVLLPVLSASPVPTEVIVVDNGSTDGTGELVAAEFGDWARCVTEPEPGLLAARHRGVAEARGEILTFLDDDVAVSETWVGAIASSFGDAGVALVGGPSRPAYEVPPPKWFSHLWTGEERGRHCSALSLLDFGDASFDIEPTFIWGLNFSIRAVVLREVGGFHPDLYPVELRHLTGDGETAVGRALEERSARARYAGGAAVVHRIPASRLTPSYVRARGEYEGLVLAYATLRCGDPPPARNRLRLRLALRAPAPRRWFDVAVADAIDRHGRWCRERPELVEWVRRPDYWDARPPALLRRSM